MTTTVTIEGANISFNGISLEELLTRVYQKGKADALKDEKSEKVTFIKLSKELKETGRNISVVTLTQKARDAKVKVFQFDGKRLACYRSDVPKFVDV